MIVNVCPGHCALHLDEIILFRQANRLLLANLLLAILSLVVALFTHTIQVVLHLLLLSAHLLNSSHLLLSEVLVTEVYLLLLPLTSLSCSLFLSFLLGPLLFVFLLPFEHSVVILVLQVLQLTSLLARLLNLLDRPQLLILEHPYSVSQLLNVSLKL